MSGTKIQEEKSEIHYASTLLKAGFSVIPFGNGHWVADSGRYAKRLPTEKELENWFGDDRGDGADLEVFCGDVSRGLRCLDFDNHTGVHGDLFDRWRAKVTAGMASLLNKVSVFRTRTLGGYRVAWLCVAEPDFYGEEVAGVLHNGTHVSVIESLTRMRVPGGHTKEYEYVSGPRLENLKPILAHEQDFLVNLAVGFHEDDAPVKKYVPPDNEVKIGGRPGDYFNEHADWCEILEPKGWSVHCCKKTGVVDWTRPGKHWGVSARTGGKGHNSLYIFTSNAAPFAKDTGYTPFTAFAMLYHGGDYTAAARQISERGFGDVPPFEEAGMVRLLQDEDAVNKLYQDKQDEEPPNETANDNEKFANLHEASKVVDGWPDPISLSSLLGEDIPPFPIDAVKDIVPQMYDLCKVVAHQVQVPVDVPALMSLAVLSAPISDRVKVAIRPGSYAPTILWTLGALPPGERKTPAVTPIWQPVKDWEERQRKEMRDSVRIQQARRKMAKHRIARLEKLVQKESDPAKIEELTKECAALDAVLAGPEPEEPRLLVDDATTESLVPMLQAHGGKAACLSDEAVFLEIAMGRYSSDPRLELYLRGHDGADYRCDRSGKGFVYLPSVHITFGFCIQVEPLKKYASDTTARERGFFPRFLAAMPRSLMGHREIVRQADRTEAQEAWNTLVTRLLDDRSKLHLEHSEEGYQMIEAFERQYEPLLAENRELASLRAFVGKAVSGQMLRVAGVLHCASGTKETIISTGTIKAAIMIIEYFIAHAKHIHGVLEEDQAMEVAKLIRNHIVMKKIKKFPHREFRRHLWSVRSTSDAILDTAYLYLARANLIRLSKITRQTVVFEVNPKLLE